MLNEIRRLPGKGAIPPVDYSGFEDFIASRLSPSTILQASLTSDQSSNGENKYSEVVRTTRRSVARAGDNNDNIYARPRLYSNGDENDNVEEKAGYSRPGRKREYEEEDDASSSQRRAAPSSSRPPRTTRVPKVTVPFDFPRSKSKLTINIGFEKMLHSNPPTGPQPPQATFLSRVNYSSHEAAQLPQSGGIRRNTSIGSRMSDMSLGSSLIFNGIGSEIVSFEDYNRQKFGQAIGGASAAAVPSASTTVLPFNSCTEESGGVDESMDFDSIFPSQIIDGPSRQ